MAVVDATDPWLTPGNDAITAQSRVLQQPNPGWISEPQWALWACAGG